MTIAPPPTPFLHLVVGYDGSPPATRALEAAILLLQGRTGRLEVVYVTHLSGVVVEAPVAPPEMEPGFDEIEQELRGQATRQLSDSSATWAFVRRVGNITEELSALATDISDANPSGREFVLADPPGGRLSRGRPGPPSARSAPDRAIGTMNPGSIT